MRHEIGRQVLEAEARAIRDLIPRMGPAFDAAVGALASCQGRVVIHTPFDSDDPTSAYDPLRS